MWGLLVQGKALVSTFVVGSKYIGVGVVRCEV